MGHVMISYAHANSDFADIVKKQIEDAGFEVWIDTSRLRAGEEWRDAIDNAITSAMAVVVILSPASYESKYVTYEWAAALGMQIPIVPILLYSTAMHPRMEVLQHLDFRLEAPWGKLIRRLIEIQKNRPDNYPYIKLRMAPPSVQQAVLTLDSPMPKDRRDAIESLAQINHPTATEAMIEALDHPLRDVRVRILDHLAQTIMCPEQAIPELRKLYEDPEEEVRRRAIAFLATSNSISAAPLLLEAQNDSDRGVRYIAEMAIREIGAQRISFYIVEKALQDGHHVQDVLMLVQPLKRIGYSLYKIVAHIIVDRMNPLRNNALEWLLSCPESDRITRLYPRLQNDPDTRIRNMLMDYASRIGHVEMLAIFLTDPDDLTRWRAAKTLRLLDILPLHEQSPDVSGPDYRVLHYHPAFITRLTQHLLIADDLTQPCILHVLRRGGATVVRSLICQLLDEDESAQQAAGYALDYLGKDILDKLIALLDTPDFDEGAQATIDYRSFWRLVSQRLVSLGRVIIPHLLGAIRDPGSSAIQRRNAAQVLGLLRDPAAIPLLANMLNETGELRLAAALALRKIGTTDALVLVDRWQMGQAGNRGEL